MARSRRRSDGSRDAFAITSPSLRSVYDLVRPIEAVVYSPLQEIEDRREYYPDPFVRPARATERSASRLVVPKTQRLVLPQNVRFGDPNKVMVCVRRKRRREVLHAIGRAGAGGRSPRWSEYSHVSCK